MNDKELKRKIEIEVLKQCAKNGLYYVPAAVSARHVHLCRGDVEALFGKGYRLRKLKDLSQPGQFACEERVALTGPKGTIEKVRVLGPERRETQVEISVTDSFKAGIEPVVRMSGNIEGTPGGKLSGPAGEVTLQRGVIAAARHLHMSPEEAAMYGLKSGDIVSVKKAGAREMIFGNVIVRSGEGHSLEMHIDTDEANAAGMLCGELLELIR
jgi:putative phosphotransacetylase